MTDKSNPLSAETTLYAADVSGAIDAAGVANAAGAANTANTAGASKPREATHSADGQSASPSATHSAYAAANGSGNFPSTPSSSASHGDKPVHVTSPSSTAEKISDAVSAFTSGDDDADGAKREPKYTLTIDEGVVEKISSLAAQQIDGIVDMKGSVFSMIQEGFGGSDDKKGVDADVDDGTATVELSIILEYGKSAIEVFNAIKQAVATQVHDMTGLEVTELTVNVVDVADKTAWDEEHNSGKSEGGEEAPARRTHVTLAQD